MDSFSRLLFFTFLLNGVSVILGQKKLFCYHGSWAVYRPGAGKFSIEDINPNLCTHLVYAFAGVEATGEIRVIDKWNDVDSNGYVRFNNLKLQNNKLKTLIAIGGFNEGSVKFSTIAAAPQYRQTFIETVIAFMNKYKFDGVDIDWEYPGQRGGTSADKANFAKLIQELRKALGTRYLLTIAVGVSALTVETSYNVPILAANVDFINLMTYDLHGPWNTETGANAPLFSPLPNDTRTVSNSVMYWISKGVSRSKLIMGIPIYGRSYTLKFAAETNVGAPTTGPGTPGPYTDEAGALGYNEIVEFIKTGQWTQVWDDSQKVPYMYKSNQWVSYDDEKSVKLKTAYIRNLGLGGAMVWSIDTDLLYPKDNKNPILTEIKQGLL